MWNKVSRLASVYCGKSHYSHQKPKVIIGELQALAPDMSITLGSLDVQQQASAAALPAQANQPHDVAAPIQPDT